MFVVLVAVTISVSLVAILLLNPFASKTSNPIIATISVGPTPIRMAYDNGNQHLYLTYGLGTRVAVIDGKQNVVSSNVSLGNGGLWGISYDQNNGDLYVAQPTNPDQIVVINDTTNSVVALVQDVGSCWEVVYDQVNGNVYATCTTAGKYVVAVISASSNTVTGYVPVGSAPYGVAFDRANKDVYVTNQESGNVSVINGTTNQPVDSIPVGPWPYEVVYDDANGDLYVSSGANGTNSVTVINGTTDRVIASVSLGAPSGDMTCDSKTNMIYVALGSSVISISGLTDKVVGAVSVATGGWGTTGIAYDSANGNVYVATTSANGDYGSVVVLKG